MTQTLHHVADAGSGLALETARFKRVENDAVLWTARARAIVCPAAYRKHPRFAGLGSAAGLQGWPIETRPTGGGAVPQGPGILNLAICHTAPAGFTIDEGYALITSVLADGLSEFGAELRTGDTPRSFCDGAWNLTIDGRKVAGTAQRWRPLAGGRIRILAHALLLVDGDITAATQAVAQLNQNLNLPPVHPEAHVTLREIHDADLDPEAIASRLYLSARARLNDRDRFRAAA